VKAITERLCRFDVLGNEPCGHQRRQVCVKIIVLRSVGQLRDADALKHGLHFVMVRLDASFKEELASSLFNNPLILSISDNPDAGLAYQCDGLWLRVFAAIGYLDEDGARVTAHLLAADLYLFWNGSGHPLKIRTQLCQLFGAQSLNRRLVDGERKRFIELALAHTLVKFSHRFGRRQGGAVLRHSAVNARRATE
jgi:hypothetical protein